MPELPEIHHLKDQLQEVLPGETINDINVYQPKSLNIPVDSFKSAVISKTISEVSAQGKWVFIHVENKGKIAINLGMGGEILYMNSPLEKKHQADIIFASGKRLNIRFWWFGHVHLIKDDMTHKPTNKIGIDYFDDTCTITFFKDMLSKRRGMLKNFLLNQRYLSGIGNYYIHDILYQAKLHPKRQIPSLSEEEVIDLYDAIIDELTRAHELNGSYYEEDIYGEKGLFKADKVAYKDEGKCPKGHQVKKIKTGQTTSYICPVCQK